MICKINESMVNKIKNIAKKQIINVVLLCEYPNFKNKWCIWLLSAEKGDFFFNILKINNLIVSKTGIAKKDKQSSIFW